ncbi:START domain-containing protein [Sporobolomyces salmoneus]|uniref:START domain-containing protein n=1 Tax=Sporobolomyces salmoneus TaxID=183962 RepID=UPI00316F627C
MPSEHSYQDHRARYSTAIHNAQTQLEQLLVADEGSWKPIQNGNSSSNNNNNNKSTSSSSTNDLSSTSNPTPSTSASSGTGGYVFGGNLEATRVKLDKRPSPSRGAPDVMRATLDLPLPSGMSKQEREDLLESFRVALRTTEIRPIWDKLVEQATTLEIVDPYTRVYKTDYRLGWPASPRDTITISKTTSSSSRYLIDCSTSLPRFADEPSFLRPSPPYVRSHVNLYAWVLQINDPGEEGGETRLRVRLYWSWSLNSNRFTLNPPTIPTSSLSSSSATSISSTTSGTLNTTSCHPYHLHFPHLLLSLVNYIKSTTTTGSPSSSLSTSSSNQSLTGGGGGNRIPSLRNWNAGNGIQVTKETWDESSMKWNGEWDLVYHSPSNSLSTSDESEGEGMDEIEGMEGIPNGEEEERRRKKRKGKEKELRVEVGLPIPAAAVGVNSTNSTGGGGGGGGKDGWDIRIIVQNLGGTSSTPSTRQNSIEKSTEKPGGGGGSAESTSKEKEKERYSIELETTEPREGTKMGMGLMTRYRMRVVHEGLVEKDGLERYRMGITRLVGGKGVRVNGNLVPVKFLPIDNDEAEEEEEEEEGPEAREIEKFGELLKRSLDLERQQENERNLLLGSGSSSIPSPKLLSSSASTSNHSSISIRSSTSTLSPQQVSLLASSQISTLLRRNYIYFLSLLQEPPQKWKPITDSSSGVTITQLLSPDPTLTIYRAEAVFVGVGVWDVFASVLSSWGTVGNKGLSWDKGIEESRLVKQENGRHAGNGGGGNGNGELSEVWWEKRKGNWPVAPRDSVTLRTSYKSPTSIHIFSFSTDDTSLFPSIPPVQPPTIRTQTDLSGWSIESLSPTTTSITLLDQSDPKGWSNKSWTPNQLVQAVAGVRDFTIKYGAPPVVTRLSGARKREVGFDHEKGMFRVEYEIDSSSSSSEGSSGSGSETSSLMTETSTIKSLNHNQNHGTTSPIELELRCDVSVWSPQGLELMIDPPPSSVSCLSRHRLSSGGGLWLTIEHPPLIVRESGEGKVIVTVRKASKSNSSGGGGEKGGVVINGARVKVDVEVLEEEKIRELEARKRRKFSPVPLDQYETLGARVWANNNGTNSIEAKRISVVGIVGNEAGEKGEGGDSSSVNDVEEKRKPASIASIDSSIDPPISSTDLSPNPSTSDSNPPPNSTAVKSPLEPPAAALEALAYLQSFHAEQGPELTDPAPGWSIVSERAGTVVRKKMIPRISEVIPVYRGDKIVQGLTADEIASVVTSPGCRRMWDERVEQAVPLSSYGNGISTLAISTKPAFPFKGRIFYVSQVCASVKVPSASSTSSTSTVLFVASASYVPPSTPHPDSDSFDPSKINPNSLLTGQILLEGWILETLDPYTSSVLAIPSTRCTYLACIDQKGSVPLALNQVLNANLAKSIGNVESFGKTKGPIPRIWSPSNGVQIEGPLSEDGEGDCVWKLGKSSKGEGESKVIAANQGDEENTFRALFKVGGKSSTTSTSIKEEDSIGERPGNLEKKGSSSSTPTLKSVNVGSTLLKSELPRSASLNFGTAAPPILHKSSVTSELSHKRSRGSLRSKSPAAPPVATGVPPSSSSSTSLPNPSISLMTTNDPNANDLVVAEFIVDLKQYPHGYSVLASSSLSTLSDSTPLQPLSLDSLPPRSLAPSASSTPILPLRLTAHDAPLPSILTASLDAWKRANHLVRILIPTSPITHPVQDPLRDPSKTRIEKPEWYKTLTEGGGALVEIKIVPLPASPTPPSSGAGSGVGSTMERPKLATGNGNGSEPTGLGKVTGQANKTVMFNGEKVVVMSQKESRTVLARFEDEDAPLQGAKLSRVPRRKRKSSSAPVDPEAVAVSSLPLELQQPLAIATRLLAPPKPSTPVNENSDFEFPDPKSPGMMTPAMGKDSGSPVMSKSGSLQTSSNRRGTTSSDSTPLSGPLSAILGSYPLARLGSSIVNATTPSHHHTRDPADSTSEGRIVIGAQRGYSLGFVVSVALIAFLLGSFLRSLLTPADYIVYHPSTSSSSFQTSTSLASTTSTVGESVERALLSAFDPHRHWREAKRLIELRTGFIGWDLIVAAVKRD